MSIKENSEYLGLFCSGCGLCHSAYRCEMTNNSKGFPVISNKESIDIESIRNICPVFYYQDEAKHDLWGNILKAYIGYSSNEDVRFNASSGGALTELSCFLIRTGLVDGIIHTTYDSEDPTKTVTCISYNTEEIKKRCGSRYSISTPLYNIIEMIENDKKYAFIGKPCDVMALRRYLNINSKLKQQIPYLLSFFCAGEPSKDAQDKLLVALGNTKKELLSLTYRGNGWPGYTTATEKSGKKLKMQYKDTWGKYLGRDIRDYCRYCLDGTGDAADIVCADFWYLGSDGNPDFSEHDGRNIIIARTECGMNIINRAINDGCLKTIEDFTNKISSDFHKYQPAQYKRKGMMKSMFFALRLFGKKVPNYSLSYLKRYSSYMPNNEKIKYIYGTIKRIIKNRI